MFVNQVQRLLKKLSRLAVLGPSQDGEKVPRRDGMGLKTREIREQWGENAYLNEPVLSKLIFLSLFKNTTDLF